MGGRLTGHPEGQRVPYLASNVDVELLENLQAEASALLRPALADRLPGLGLLGRISAVVSVYEDVGIYEDQGGHAVPPELLGQLPN
jgi:hypothetical protein